MTDSYDVLVKRLPNYCGCGPHLVGRCTPCRAAEAIEALVKERDFVKAQLLGTNKNIAGWLEARDDNLKRAMKAEAEVAWLKEALEFIARGTTGSPDAIVARRALGEPWGCQVIKDAADE